VKDEVTWAVINHDIIAHDKEGGETNEK